MRLTQRADWTGRPILQDRETAHRVFAREEWMKVIRDALPDTPLDVLELGCAPGFLGAILFEGTPWRPFGIDYAEDADQYCESFRRIGKTATLYQGDLFDIELNRQFDVVCSFGLIEHFGENELDRVLALHDQFTRPGGYVVILVPNFTGVQYLWHHAFDRPNLDSHNVGTMTLKTFDLFDKLNYRTLFKGFHGQFRVWGNSSWTRNWFTGKSVAALSHLISKSSRVLRQAGVKLTGASLSPYILYIGQRPADDAA
jgi:SAM-dependent methyltransferase